MFSIDYTFEHNGICYKHTATDKPECDSFFMHTHNLCEILYFVSGDVTLVVEDRKYKLQKGDLMFVRPSTYHFIQIDSFERYERYDILFPESSIDCEDSFLMPEKPEIISLSSDPIADSIFRKMDYFYDELNTEHFSKVLVLLLKELFFCINIAADKMQSTEFSIINPLLVEVLKYINENIFEIESISDVAAKFFVSESYLFRKFKNELKQSPKQYITTKRLLAAQRLIGMGEKPTDIFEKCGFKDYTVFYRSYKRLFGYSPSQQIGDASSLLNDF